MSCDVGMVAFERSDVAQPGIRFLQSRLNGYRLLEQGNRLGRECRH